MRAAPVEKPALVQCRARRRSIAALVQCRTRRGSIAALVRCRARRGSIAALVVVVAVCGGAVACGGADAPSPEDLGAASRVAEPASTADAPTAEAAPVPESPVPQSPRAAEPASTADAPTAEAAPVPESPAPRPPALPLELSSPEHQRYQQLRLETLRAMIEAAKLALPIGPFQQRIDAAARLAVEDVAEAADRMEDIVADLQEVIAAAGR